ncbi:MBL fold metallo-hydrolase [Phaeobacter italicus]|nr:MBL fold metallo-hydrolase [Phaeobacter italicus]
MADFYEIDFLPVGNSKSGDAICIRYEVGGQKFIHVVDGGYEEDGQKVLDHLTEFYGGVKVDHVVATHPDGDHTVGLRKVVEEAEVGTLWMNRPWVHAEELLPYFSRYTNAENLAKALRDVFPNLAKLEEIAIERGIPILDAFQGAKIGAFTVLAPSKSGFHQYVVDDDKTPQAAQDSAMGRSLLEGAVRIVGEGLRMIQAAWGAEVFPVDDTSPRNNMSVVQYANFMGENVVLTADTGRAGLAEAAAYAPSVGLDLPADKLRLIQVPHHGSRHNVSTEILNLWLGEVGEETQETRSNAIVSAGKEDQDHPRKIVVRAFMHRGASVLETKGAKTCFSGGAAPARQGWVSSTPLTYPSGYEE